MLQATRTLEGTMPDGEVVQFTAWETRVAEDHPAALEFPEFFRSVGDDDYFGSREHVMRAAGVGGFGQDTRHMERGVGGGERAGRSTADDNPWGVNPEWRDKALRMLEQRSGEMPPEAVDRLDGHVRRNDP